MRFLDILRHRE